MVRSGIGAPRKRDLVEGFHRDVVRHARLVDVGRLELDEGKGKRFGSTDELFSKLDV